MNTFVINLTFKRILLNNCKNKCVTFQNDSYLSGKSVILT